MASSVGVHALVSLGMAMLHVKPALLGGVLVSRLMKDPAVPLVHAVRSSAARL